MLAKQAFILKAKTKCGAAGCLIKGIAFPFISTIAQIFEHVRGHKIHSLRRQGCTHQRWGKPNGADLARAPLRDDTKIAGHAKGPAVSSVNYCEDQGIVTLVLRFQPFLEFGLITKWPKAHIRPYLSCGVTVRSTRSII
ncbi:uncharacterized protein METZ01_LOCUS111448 [marine metagenome]|uniref:Uncharacterized protein n=1 Tax=marine metagenome TaxID=408172 RepID=A0A381X1H0_9ZZZZ